MSPEVFQEMLRFLLIRAEDPEMKASQVRFVESLARVVPEAAIDLVQEARDQGRRTAARDAVRDVLAQRKLVPSPEDEARIDACADLPTLRRWLLQALHAPSAADALQ